MESRGVGGGGWGEQDQGPSGGIQLYIRHSSIRFRGNTLRGKTPRGSAVTAKQESGGGGRGP